MPRTFLCKKWLGLIREVISPDDISRLPGNTGIGHVRYRTAGGFDIEDVQPLWIGSPRGIALAHNGNLTNYKALALELTQQRHRHLNSSIDSEVLLHWLADGLNHHHDAAEDEIYFSNSICSSIKNIFENITGSYSVVSVIIGKGLVAFRDPHGIRPLVMGERTRADGKKDYIFASETTMFHSLGFEPVGDVLPGEVVFVSQSGKLFRKTISKKQFSPCVFEYVYFSRPDTTMNGVNVYRSRLHMGQNLARRWRETFPDLLPDVVIPVPFTSNTAALSFAHELGVRYSEGLYKNPFIGRTFIMPDGQQRTRGVRYKLTPQKAEIDGNKVLLLDDSIVRGTTSREIIRTVKQYGAKEVYLVSTCPPVKFPCFYGVDIPTHQELIAANSSLDEIRDYLEVDQLLYQEIDGLVEAVSRREDQLKNPCMACLNGKYVTNTIKTTNAEVEVT